MTRPLLAAGEPLLPASLLFDAAKSLASSLALDRRSPAARLCCRNAETSTSDGSNVNGDTSFRFPLRSRGRAICNTSKQHKSVGNNTRMEACGRRSLGIWTAGWAEDLWPLTTYCRGHL